MLFVCVKASCEVMINNKNSSLETEPSLEVSVPSLRSPSASSHTSGFDERSLDSAIFSPMRSTVLPARFSL